MEEREAINDAITLHDYARENTNTGVADIIERYSRVENTFQIDLLIPVHLSLFLLRNETTKRLAFFKVLETELSEYFAICKLIQLLVKAL